MTEGGGKVPFEVFTGRSGGDGVVDLDGCQNNTQLKLLS